MTHGQRVSYCKRAQELIHWQCYGARLIVCGHSHFHEAKHIGDTLFVNPGSIALPRDGSGGTFAIVTYEDGAFDVEFVYKQDII